MQKNTPCLSRNNRVYFCPIVKNGYAATQQVRGPAVNSYWHRYGYPERRQQFLRRDLERAVQTQGSGHDAGRK